MGARRGDRRRPGAVLSAASVLVLVSDADVAGLLQPADRGDDLLHGGLARGSFGVDIASASSRICSAMRRDMFSRMNSTASGAA
jgi:hypothetical protein